MKDEVADAIAAGIIQRRELLQSLTLQQQTILLEELFTEFFGDLHITLQKWAALTGQSAQVDTGYIAQFVASLVLKEPGQGFRGKGDDLADGSEVKSAAVISGVDRPRWNHNMGTPAQDRDRMQKGKGLASDEYLDSPYLFYLLVDRSASDNNRPKAIRIRGWLLDAQADVDWRDLLARYQNEKVEKQYNLQLHPPVAYDDNVVVNTLGNLDFSEVLVFDARVRHSAESASPTVEWVKPLENDVVPQMGRTRAVPYGGRGSRPSRLTGASDLVADIAVVAHLFPHVLGDDQATKLITASAREVAVETEPAAED